MTSGVGFRLLDYDVLQNRIMSRIALLVLFSVLFFQCDVAETTEATPIGFDNFITAEGYNLLDGQDTVRFISWNIPNLNYVEDELKFESSNPYTLPTEYEIRDALMTIKEMGGQVVRMYTLPVRSSKMPADAVTYVEAPGVFNEEAFKNLDLVMSLADEIGVRVIIPFLNNWQWFGGVPNYAEFRDKTYDDFWTDEQLWSDFQATVDHLLNRTNTINGKKYIEDKAIFCWESGNELQNPYPWVQRLAAHVKSLDANHLFMDGYHAVDDTPFYAEAFTDEHIDIISSHHYEIDPMDMLRNIKAKVETIDGRKPYFVGEFGFVSTTGLKMVLDYLMKEQRICGAMSWSIRHHHREGGFYWHSEPAGLDLYKAFHWPGFVSGENYDEENLLSIFRESAFEIQAKHVPEVSIPAPPKMLPCLDGNTLRWQGSMGARYYQIYRQEKGETAWELIEPYASETDRPYFPGFIDENSEIGKSYLYKMKAVNESGSSDYSNVISVDAIESKLFVDHPANTAKSLSSKNVTIESGGDRDYKEMLTRMKGVKGSEVQYRTEGNIQKVVVYAFSKEPSASLSFSTSSDGINFLPASYEFEEFSLGDQLYDYMVPVKYILHDETENNIVRIEFDNITYIGRIEINHK